MQVSRKSSKRLVKTRLGLKGLTWSLLRPHLLTFYEPFQNIKKWKKIKRYFLWFLFKIFFRCSIIKISKNFDLAAGCSKIFTSSQFLPSAWSDCFLATYETLSSILPRRITSHINLYFFQIKFLIILWKTEIVLPIYDIRKWRVLHKLISEVN